MARRKTFVFLLLQSICPSVAWSTGFVVTPARHKRTSTLTKRNSTRSSEFTTGLSTKHRPNAPRHTRSNDVDERRRSLPMLTGSRIEQCEADPAATINSSSTFPSREGAHVTMEDRVQNHRLLKDTKRRQSRERSPQELSEAGPTRHDDELSHQHLVAILRDSAHVSAACVASAIMFLVHSDAAAAAAAVATTANVELVAQTAAPVDLAAIFAKAGKASLGGGVSGAAAAVVQVLSLMWLRTTMNFQYKNGGTTKAALQTLWDEGGIARLYRGISFALVQGPLSRFGDTAANVGVLTLLEAFESTRSLPLPLKSAAGSTAAGLWRIGLTPIDAYKTTLQVSGAQGTKVLADKVAANGPSVLFEGALATATATFVGHYPWYFTYNSLGAWLPPAPTSEPLLKLGRQAFLGLCSSCVSDCCSNSIRVVKTTKQTAPIPLSYPEALKQVVDEDGVTGLFIRGLQTRILVNALQGALFAVAWKYFEELFKSSAGL